MENKTTDEYRLPIEPNQALALTMNFPQFVDRADSNEARVSAEFNSQCPDCLAELFGPIMAPYAILQRQYDQYRTRLEDIAARRYRTMANQLTQRKKSKLPERSLITEVRHFLKPPAFRQRLFLMILTGWIFVIAAFFLIIAMFLIAISDDYQPVLTFVRTLSKFYRTFLFQGIIAYGTIYSFFLLMTGISTFLAAFVCSIWLILIGTVIGLLASVITIIGPAVIFLYRKTFFNELQKYLRISLNDFDDLPTNSISLFWNRFQKLYLCCALGDPLIDYRSSYFRQLTGLIVPESCCRKGLTCSNGPTVTNAYLDTSCLIKVEIVFDRTLIIIGIGHALIAAFLISSLVISLMFFSHLRLANQALKKHQTDLIDSILLTIEQNRNENETQIGSRRVNEKFHGILPITPTIVRMKTPRIVHYLGFG